MMTDGTPLGLFRGKGEEWIQSTHVYPKSSVRPQSWMYPTVILLPTWDCNQTVNLNTYTLSITFDLFCHADLFRIFPWHSVLVTIQSGSYHLATANSNPGRPWPRCDSKKFQSDFPHLPFSHHFLDIDLLPCFTRQKSRFRWISQLELVLAGMLQQAPSTFGNWALIQTQRCSCTFDWIVELPLFFPKRSTPHWLGGGLFSAHFFGGFQEMNSVFTWCGIFQVAYSIVGLVPILVVDVRVLRRWRRPKEGSNHKLMTVHATQSACYGERETRVTYLVSIPCGDVARSKSYPAKGTHQHSLNSLGWLRVNHLLPHFTMKRLLFYSCHCILVAINCKIQPAILGEHTGAYSKLLCSKFNWWACHKACGTNRSPHYRLHARWLRFACHWACKEVSQVLAASYIFQNC